MFGLRYQIKIKQARSALREGRLDEAYAIATEKDIREHRGGQVLLEALVDPLLDRAEEHFSDGRLADALADVQRALDVGGNRPRTAKLRGEVRKAIDEQKKRAKEASVLLDSVRRHLDKGSIHAGRERLANATDESGDGDRARQAHRSGEIARLRRLAENRERAGVEARQRAETYLENGAIEQALDAARDAVEAHEKDAALPDLLVRLKRAAFDRLQESFRKGELGVAGERCERLQPLFGSHIEIRGLCDALAYAEQAARAIVQNDYDEARIALGRIENLVADCDWARREGERLETATSALRELRSGPLGMLAEKTPAKDFDSTVTGAGGRRRPRTDRRGPRHGDRGQPIGKRMLLWVDGIGTYLILTSERISVGRAGSSSSPDIALSADISGHHAEILRVEDDYFVVPSQGKVLIDGVEQSRKLLANNDRLDLGRNCRLTFHLPTPMSNTAMLGLHRGQRIEKDVRKVVLLDRELILGPKGNCHIQVPAENPAMITVRNDKLYCRASDDVMVDGLRASSVEKSQAGGVMPVVNEVEIPLGAQICVGDLSFTVTASIETGDGELGSVGGASQ